VLYSIYLYSKNSRNIYSIPIAQLTKQLLFQTQISTIGQFIDLGEISVPKRLIKQPVNSINTETVNSINTETVNSINTETVHSINTETVNSINTETVNSKNIETSYQGNHLVKNNIFVAIAFYYSENINSKLYKYHKSYLFMHLHIEPI